MITYGTKDPCPWKGQTLGFSATPRLALPCLEGPSMNKQTESGSGSIQTLYHAVLILPSTHTHTHHTQANGPLFSSYSIQQ